MPPQTVATLLEEGLTAASSTQVNFVNALTASLLQLIKGVIVCKNMSFVSCASIGS